MCQYNNTIKEKKFKQINYNERTQIERWYNIEQKSKSEIGRLLGRPEGSIRREIKRGLVDNITTDLKVIKVYLVYFSQEEILMKLKKLVIMLEYFILILKQLGIPE